MADSASIVGNAMKSLAQRRPVFHSEADFQHALAWEIQTTHPTASIRLEKRVALSPNIELDLLVVLEGESFGVELKYPRRNMTVDVRGERFTLATGANDFGRVYALEDFARLERLVAEHVLDQGVFLMLTNDAKVWSPSSSSRPVLYDEFRVHDGHVLSGRMAWGNWGRPPQGGGIVELRGSYTLVWRDYSTFETGEFRYLLVGIGR